MAGTHEFLEDSRNKDVLVYLNGDLVHRDVAKVSVFDSGFLLGDGVWESFRLHNGKIAFLDPHLDRLFASAKLLDLNMSISRQDIVNVLYKTVHANKMTTGAHIRLMITRGLKKTPFQDPRINVGGATVVIIAEHKVVHSEATKRGIRLFTVHVRRGRPDVLDPKLHVHSKLNCIISLIQAIKAGADEALMLDPHGFVSTCNSTNFFIVRKNQVWTSTGRYCLNGITRGVVIDLCRENGIEVFERDFSLTEVYSADEAFVTGTFGGLTPVAEVDGRVIGDGKMGPMTMRLGELYNAKLDEECPLTG